MLTQKQGIKNFLEGIDSKLIRKHFVCEWLEDINWHGECAAIRETFSQPEKRLLDELHKVDVILNPGQYAAMYVRSSLWELPKETVEKVKDWWFSNIQRSSMLILEYTSQPATVITDDLYYGYKRCHGYSAFNYIFGWGLDASWENTQGQKFVDELLQLIESK